MFLNIFTRLILSILFDNEFAFPLIQGRCMCILLFANERRLFCSKDSLKTKELRLTLGHVLGDYC